MEMIQIKKFNSLLLILLFWFPYFSNPYEYYEDIYQEFVNSADVIDFFKPYLNKDSMDICISEKTVNIPREMFVTDIVDYYYGDLNKDDKKKIIDSLLYKEMTSEVNYQVNYDIELRNIDCKEHCDIIVYFMEPRESMIFGFMFIDNHFSNEFVDDARNSKVSIEFLVFFKDDAIDKVIYKKMIQ